MKKKILIAVDSFKGTLTSSECADIIEEGILASNKNLAITKVPIADGGEGTVESIVEALKGQYLTAVVNDPLGRSIESQYGFLSERKTAIIEMAAASGIHLLKENELNPLITSTYGTGELILDAVKKGAEIIIIGIGGSATNDGGTGMASALGIKFLDSDGNEIIPHAKELNKIESIDFSELHPEVSGIKFLILCDVDNPLCGINGASAVYAPQKGANATDVKLLDENLFHLSQIVKNVLQKDYACYPGSGAAGGLGFGLMTFLNAELKKGIQFIIDFIGLEEKIKDADLVITGEGKLDNQTSNNKAPWGILQISKKYNKPIIGVSAIIEEGSKDFLKDNFNSIYSVVGSQVSVEQSFSDPSLYLKNLAKKIGTDIEKFF